MEKVVQQHLDNFNDRWQGLRPTVNEIQTYHTTNFVHGLRLAKVAPLKHRDGSKYGEVEGIRDKEINRLRVRVPVRARSLSDGPLVSFKTEIDIQMEEFNGMSEKWDTPVP